MKSSASFIVGSIERYHRPQVSLAGLSLVLVAGAWAFLGSIARCDSDLSSGPAPNDPVAPLKVFVVSADDNDQKADVAERSRKQPTLYLFVDAARWNRPMFRFVKTLEEQLGDSDQVVAVWLAKDVDESKTYLAKIRTYFVKAALCVAEASPEGPKDWGINPDASLTVVATRQGKVVKSWGYRAPDETRVKEVLAEWKSKP